MVPTNKQLLEMYRWLVIERLLDEKVDELYRMGKIMSMYHSVQGQETAYVGAYYGLKEGDAFITRSRGNAVYLMRGWDLNDYMAGMFGKKEGIGQGRTPVGSHMCGDPAIGLLPVAGLIGSSFTVGIGAALAFKLQHRRNVALVICGDGGSNRGDVHEGMNFAVVLNLPAVFYVINNGWSISVPASYAVSVEHISDRAAGYGIPGVTIDGRDMLQVYETVSDAIERARDGGGPSMVEAVVDRWTAHSGNDPDIYRTDEERAEARKIDPIRKYETVLIARGLLDEAKKKEITAGVVAEIEAAIEYAENCTEPDFDCMTYGVYKEVA